MCVGIRKAVQRAESTSLPAEGVGFVACADISLNLPEYLESHGTAVVSWLLALSRLMQLNWRTLANREEDL